MMKWLKIIGLAAMAILAAVAAIFAGKSKRTGKEAAALREALAHVKERAERVQAAAGETAKAEEKANEKRKSLAETADADLVNRANKLF